MVNIKVRTIWQGKVGIHPKFLDECLEKKDDLCIEHEGDFMQIKFSDLPKKLVGKSKETFLDKFSQQPYQIYYFKWSPIKHPKTQSLL